MKCGSDFDSMTLSHLQSELQAVIVSTTGYNSSRGSYCGAVICRGGKMERDRLFDK